MSPSPSCGYGYRRVTEANGLSAFRVSGTAWFRWRRCWSLVPSLRWTCCPSSMDSAPGWMPRGSPTGLLARDAARAAGGCGRGLARLLQLNSARAVDAKSGPPHRRWAYTPCHQMLAYSAGCGGHRWAVGADRRSAKDEAGNPAGRSDFAAAGKLLLPALPASLARPWPSGPTRCPRCQLRRRLRHLLPTWQRAGGDGADGDVDDAAWVGSERQEDPDRPTA